MLLFCPTCANILECEEGLNACYRFSCSTCPYIYNITKRISSRTYTKLKEVDDVLGGAAAWENVDSIEEQCPKCENKRAYFMQIQTRSADEPIQHSTSVLVATVDTAGGNNFLVFYT